MPHLTGAPSYPPRGRGLGPTAPLADPGEGMGYRVGVDPPVREVAEIELDGEPCGLLWRPPYRLDLGDRLEAGEHRLRITVHGTTASAVAADPHAAERIAAAHAAFGVRFEQQETERTLEGVRTGLLAVPVLRRRGGS